VIRFHDKNLKYEPQIRLLRNWLSYAVSCAAAGFPGLSQGSPCPTFYLINATSAALMVLLGDFAWTLA